MDQWSQSCSWLCGEPRAKGNIVRVKAGYQAGKPKGVGLVLQRKKTGFPEVKKMREIFWFFLITL